ncbi:unnamed protein product [Aphanomyces euteiches]
MINHGGRSLKGGFRVGYKLYSILIGYEILALHLIGSNILDLARRSLADGCHEFGHFPKDLVKMKTALLLVGALTANAVAKGYAPTRAPTPAPYADSYDDEYYDSPSPDDYNTNDDYSPPSDDYSPPSDDYEPPSDDYNPTPASYDDYNDNYVPPSNPSDNYYDAPYQSYDGYPTDMYTPQYSPSDSYVTEVHNIKRPYPTITLEGEVPLRLPHLGQYHCFLQGAPWTNCGGKSLREFFLDQCLTLYYRWSASVDGLCVGASKTPPPAPKPSPTPAPYNDDEDDDSYYSSYSSYGYSKPAPKKTTSPPHTTKPAPTYASPYVAPSYCDAYYEERCLQTSYVSIITATVQCLTENSIRILFIEKYAAAASNNPVEGPILYLKKLHEFISQVIKCNPDKVGNYPTLWRRFTSQLGVKYWPTAPFTVGQNNRIDIPRCTSRQASGWNVFETNGRFYCPNPDTLLTSPPLLGSSKFGTYSVDSTDRFYDAGAVIDTDHCNAEIYGYTGVSPLLKRCEILQDPTENVATQYSNPDTLRGLLDSVRVWDTATKANVRPSTLAETAARFRGTQKQPILEGNGILYFCAFYACRANNDGDVSSCFPGVSNTDWALPHYKVDVWNQLTDDIQECLDEQWITAEDVNEIAKRLTQDLRHRTHICQAEAELVAFFKVINGDFDVNVQDGHWVYLRQLAYERCSHPNVYPNDGPLGCEDVDTVYEQLFVVLRKIKNRCISRMASYVPPAPTKPPTYYKPSKPKTTKPNKYVA